MCELAYSKATSNPARWVLAVPEDSPVHCAADLAGTIVASELVNTTRRYFAERGVNVKKARPQDMRMHALCAGAQTRDSCGLYSDMTWSLSLRRRVSQLRRHWAVLAPRF